MYTTFGLVFVVLYSKLRAIYTGLNEYAYKFVTKKSGVDATREEATQINKYNEALTRIAARLNDDEILRQRYARGRKKRIQNLRKLCEYMLTRNKTITLDEANELMATSPEELKVKIDDGIRAKLLKVIGVTFDTLTELARVILTTTVLGAQLVTVVLTGRMVQPNRITMLARAITNLQWIPIDFAVNVINVMGINFDLTPKARKLIYPNRMVMVRTNAVASRQPVVGYMRVRVAADIIAKRLTSVVESMERRETQNLLSQVMLGTSENTMSVSSAIAGLESNSVDGLKQIVQALISGKNIKGSEATMGIMANLITVCVLMELCGGNLDRNYLIEALNSVYTNLITQIDTGVANQNTFADQCAFDNNNIAPGVPVVGAFVAEVQRRYRAIIQGAPIQTLQMTANGLQIGGFNVRYLRTLLERISTQANLTSRSINGVTSAQMRSIAAQAITKLDSITNVIDLFLTSRNSVLRGLMVGLELRPVRGNYEIVPVDLIGLSTLKSLPDAIVNVDRQDQMSVVDRIEYTMNEVLMSEIALYAAAQYTGMNHQRIVMIMSGLKLTDMVYVDSGMLMFKGAKYSFGTFALDTEEYMEQFKQLQMVDTEDVKSAITVAATNVLFTAARAIRDGIDADLIECEQARKSNDDVFTVNGLLIQARQGVPIDTTGYMRFGMTEAVSVQAAMNMQGVVSINLEQLQANRALHSDAHIIADIANILQQAVRNDYHILIYGEDGNDGGAFTQGNIMERVNEIFMTPDRVTLNNWRYISDEVKIRDIAGMTDERPQMPLAEQFNRFYRTSNIIPAVDDNTGLNERFVMPNISRAEYIVMEYVYYEGLDELRSKEIVADKTTIDSFITGNGR